MGEAHKGNADLSSTEHQNHKDITKYWGIISGLVGLFITLVIFYANSVHAMEHVKDHEIRIRNLEKTMVATETALSDINRRLTSIDNKLERSINK